MPTRRPEDRVELLQGTLDVLILRTLLLGPAHGHAIVKAIESNSEDVLQVEQGSLYPALHRLERRGWIRPLTADERRRPYEITAVGQQVLAEQLQSMQQIVRTGRQRIATA